MHGRFGRTGALCAISDPPCIHSSTNDSSFFPFSSQGLHRRQAIGRVFPYALSSACHWPSIDRRNGRQEWTSAARWQYIVRHSCIAAAARIVYASSHHATAISNAAPAPHSRGGVGCWHPWPVGRVSFRHGCRVITAASSEEPFRCSGDLLGCPVILGLKLEHVLCIVYPQATAVLAPGR